jgi:succinate dehydrogenase (ubiquinone) cytochrome b560 subunit
MKLSPHVSIYRFPLSAVTSILNRGTGCYLSGVFIGTGISYLTPFPLKEIPEYVEASVAGSLIYHSLGGIRHCVWDLKPSLMTNSFAKWSSVGLLLSSFGITSSYIYLKNKNHWIK